MTKPDSPSPRALVEQWRKEGAQLRWGELESGVGRALEQCADELSASLDVQQAALLALGQEMSLALQLGALFNSEAFDTKDAVLRWRDRLAALRGEPAKAERPPRFDERRATASTD